MALLEKRKRKRFIKPIFETDILNTASAKFSRLWNTHIGIESEPKHIKISIDREE